MHSLKKVYPFPFEEQLPLPAPSLREGVEAWLAAVTFLTHHTGLAAAAAIAVTLCGKGACRWWDREIRGVPPWWDVLWGAAGGFFLPTTRVRVLCNTPPVPR